MAPVPAVAGRSDGVRDFTFHNAAVVLQLGNEEDAIRVGECMGVDGVFDLCWKRIEREYLSLGEGSARSSLGTWFCLLKRSLERRLPATAATAESDLSRKFFLGRVTGIV